MMQVLSGQERKGQPCANRALESIGDLLKRIIRVKNQDRERDIIKMAVWCPLYWLRFHYAGGDEGM